MSMYGRYSPPPQRSPLSSYLWPFLLLLVLVPLLLWRFWPHRDADEAPVVLRSVTARGSKTELEKTNIELFNKASPSVVHVTRLGLRRDDYFNLKQVPEGTGSGFIW